MDCAGSLVVCNWLEYDDEGRLVTHVHDRNCENTDFNCVYYRYDEQNRIVVKIDNDQGCARKHLENCTYYSYDDADNQTARRFDRRCLYLNESE